MFDQRPPAQCAKGTSIPSIARLQTVQSLYAHLSFHNDSTHQMKKGYAPRAMHLRLQQPQSPNRHLF